MANLRKSEFNSSSSRAASCRHFNLDDDLATNVLDIRVCTFTCISIFAVSSSSSSLAAAITRDNLFMSYGIADAEALRGSEPGLR